MIAENNFEKDFTEKMIDELLKLQTRCEENVKLLGGTNWNNIKDVENICTKMKDIIPGTDAIKQKEKDQSRLTTKVNDLEIKLLS